MHAPPLSFARRLAEATALATAVLFLYMGAGARAAATLPPPSTALDAAVPVLPVMIWFYLPGYVCLFMLVLWLLRDPANFRASLVSFAGIALVAVAAFVWLAMPAPPRPVLVPRGASEWLLAWLYGFDPAANVFPSLHVANSVLCAGIAWRLDRRLGGVAWALALLVALSTVTLRQHWIADVVSGSLLGWAGVVAWARLRALAGRPTRSAA
ncbi:MAG: phosphatase PAP2 family protein [Deltaproteobacteria bacterium]|nr:phosphatase PAP2 family protein [Deltaproteobacteria bacterium]